MNNIDMVRNRLMSSQPVKAKQVDPKAEKDLKEACEGFEAVFTKKLLESMRQTLPGNGLFPKSNTIEIFESMLDQDMAEKSSRAPNSLGIKDYLFDQLKASI